MTLSQTKPKFEVGIKANGLDHDGSIYSSGTITEIKPQWNGGWTYRISNDEGSNWFYECEVRLPPDMSAFEEYCRVHEEETTNQ